MKAFGKRARTALAALLSAAVIVSGAVLGAPAAYAEEEAPAAPSAAEVTETGEGSSGASEDPAEGTGEVTGEREDDSADPVEDTVSADADQRTGVAEEGAGAAEDVADVAPEVVSPAALAKVWSPSITVELANGTPLVAGDTVYKNDVLVVKGSGFNPDANTGPALKGMKTGVYAVFGNFAEEWAPSGGAASSVRSIASQTWPLPQASYDFAMANWDDQLKSQVVLLSDEGEFESRLTLQAAAATPGSYGVFTYVAGGAAADAAQEQELRLNYVDRARPTSAADFVPEIKVYLSDGITPYTDQTLSEGDTLVVRGSGFDPDANLPVDSSGGVPIPNSLPQGTFVVFGHFAEHWQPSQNSDSTNRQHNSKSRAWLLSKNTFDQIPNNDPPMNFRDQISPQWAEIDPATGVFEASLNLHAPSITVDNGRFGVYTYAGGSGQVVNAQHELAVPVNFEAASDEKDEDTDPPSETSDIGSLSWGFHASWNGYVLGLAGGTIDVSGGATKTDGSVIHYRQVAHSYDAETGRGSIDYRGTVVYQSDFHGFNMAMKDPKVTFTSEGATLTAEVSSDETSGTSAMKRITVATFAASEPSVSSQGILTWSGLSTTMAAGLPGAWGRYGGQPGTPLTFTLGANDVGDHEEEGPGNEDSKPAPKPTPKPTPAPAPVSPVAGSLTWGVSSGFHAYTTDPTRPGKGEVRTNGVGGGAGGYVFPQATGGSWNMETRTGTVRYSGSVTFWGHGGAMVETFANPVITVNSPISGTISAGGRSFPLNLASASFTENADGSVTWRNVSVGGMVSGSGSGGGGAFPVDPVTFTVGVASSVNYGSTVTTSPALQTRTPAPTPPATTGVTVVTPPAQLVAGGEIEITASGFQPNESGILIVIYSEPIVLDDNAKADANGVVRWIGTLPEGLTGTHTITMQGSINVGQVITIEAADADASKAEVAVAESAATSAGVATPLGDAGTPAWAWWAGALALLLLAGVSTGLVVAQRRKAEGAVKEL